MRKVKGEVNPADLFTKQLAALKIAELMNLLGMITKPAHSEQQLKAAGELAELLKLF